MKKLLIVVLAAAAMVACTNDEVVSVKGGDAIAFDNVILDNATRATAEDPSLTDDNLEAFDVWAFMDKYDGVVFTDEDVTKSGDAWGYVNTQYWLPDKTYYFFALAPMDNTDAYWKVELAEGDPAKLGIGTVTFNNAAAEGGQDLIYSEYSYKTEPTLTAAPPKVKFVFDHLLSKVKFTFVNGFNNDNANIKVTNIRMTAPANGEIDLAVADYTKGWKPSTDNTTLSFGEVELLEGIGAAAESAKERLTIPAVAEREYTVTFTVDLYMGDVLALEGQNLTATVSGAVLEMGKAYNFKATLNETNISENGSELYPIEFDVIEVKEWVNAGDVVATQNYAETITIADGQTFDGNNATITAAADRAAGQNGILTPEGTVTIKNVTIDGNNETTETDQVMRGIYIKKGGTYTVDNVKILNCGYSINVTTSEAVVLNVSNSVLQSWISWGTSTTATFDNVEFKPGTYAIMRPQGSATFTNCKFAEGFKFSLDKLVGNLTFENCFYNGEALTAIEDSMIDTTYYDVNDVTLNRNKVIFQ